MKVVLIGAGNLATQLGKSLRLTGFEIVQLYSRTEESASCLSAKLGCDYTTDLGNLRTDADVYIASIKDDALLQLIPQMVAGKREDALFLHTAGSVPMDVWKGYARHYGVLYPMQTFSKQRDVDFSTIPVFVEASSDADLQRVKTMASALSGSVTVASSEQRRYLHLSAVFACNFANHMFTISERLLSENGIDFRCMYPLIFEMVNKVFDGMSPGEAQTGPAVRYDHSVMDKHVELLRSHPLWQQIYEEMSKSIHDDKLRLDEDKSAGL